MAGIYESKTMYRHSLISSGRFHLTLLCQSISMNLAMDKPRPTAIGSLLALGHTVEEHGTLQVLHQAVGKNSLECLDQDAVRNA